MSDKIILTSTEDVTIRYTIDGSTPDESSPVYSEPIDITNIDIIRARGYSENGEASDVSEIRFGDIQATLADVLGYGRDSIGYNGDRIGWEI